MVVVVTEKGGAPKRFEFQKTDVTIGRVQGNDIVLPKGNVSKQHSRIVYDGANTVILDMKSTNGTYVNHRKITGPHVLQGEDKIFIGDFVIQIEGVGGVSAAAPVAPAPIAPAPVPVAPVQAASPIAPVMPQPRPPVSPPIAPPQNRPPAPLLAPNPPAQTAAPIAPPSQAAVPARNMAANPASNSPVAPRKVQPTMALDQPQERRTASTAGQLPPQASPANNVRPMPPMSLDKAKAVEKPADLRVDAAPVMELAAAPVRIAGKRIKAWFEPAPEMMDATRAERIRAKASLLGRLGDAIDITDAGNKGTPNPELWDRAMSLLTEYGRDVAGVNNAMLQEVRAEALGVGPLGDLLADSDVSEILVNGPHQIVTIRSQEIRTEEPSFATELGLLCAIDRLLQGSRQSLDQSRGSVDTKLQDGTRIIACFPPLSSRGTTLSIKKPVFQAYSLADLVGQGVMSEGVAGLLGEALLQRRSIWVVGAMGSGQGVVLSALTQSLPLEERIALIEESPDLQVFHPQVIHFEQTEGFSLSQVGRFAPTRLVLPTALSLGASNLTHLLYNGLDGAVLGLVAQGLDDAFDRITAAIALSLQGAKASLVREMLARSLPILVLVSRDPAGGRRVIQLAEIGEGLSLREIEIG